MASRRLPGLSPGVWAMALVERMATSASKRKRSTPRRDKKPELTGANMSPDLIPAQGRVQALAGGPFLENAANLWRLAARPAFPGRLEGAASGARERRVSP